MKKLLLASAALIGTAAVASAADLPRRAAPPPVFTPVPVFTWTGFYAGFNAGYGFGTQDDRAPTVIGVPAASGLFTNAASGNTGVLAFGNRNNNEGFVGGGQIGYNYQFTPGSGFVVGIEADAQYADFGRNRNRFAATPGLNPGSLVFNPNGVSSLDYFGTVRGRLGYAFDRTLVYGTGGFAYGSGQDDQNFSGNRFRDSFRTGWAAGGGVEYALPTDSFLNFFRSSAVTLKVEGLYVNLDRNRGAGQFAVNPAGGAVALGQPGVVQIAGPANRRNETEFAVVRAGINYKFGSY